MTLEPPRKKSRTDKVSNKEAAAKAHEDEPSSEHGSDDPNLIASIIRYQQSSDIKQQLDNHTCLISKTRGDHVEACPIIPFPFNLTSENKPKIRTRLSFWTHYLCLSGFDYHSDVFIPPPDSLSNQAWNMVLLDRDLHAWWREGYFGLKYLGVKEDVQAEGSEKEDMKRLMVQFYWMPRRRHLGDPAERTRQGIESILGTTYGDPPTPPAENVATTELGAEPVRRHVQTGDIFWINVRAADVENTMIALDLRWELTVIRAMGGGTKVLEGVEDPPIDPYGDFLADLGKRLMKEAESYQDD